MTIVRLLREPIQPPFSRGWMLKRVSDGRTEALGFKSKAEAVAFAAQYKLRIVDRMGRTR